MKKTFVLLAVVAMWGLGCQPTDQGGTGSGSSSSSSSESRSTPSSPSSGTQTNQTNQIQSPSQQQPQ